MRLRVFTLSLMSCGPACAHSVFGETDSFWSGAGHVFMSPVAVAVICAAACRLATMRPGAAYLGILIAGLVCAMVAGLGASAVFAGPMAAMVLGLLAAGAPPHPRWEPVALGLLAGLGAGVSAALDMGRVVPVVGAAAAMAASLIFAYEGLVRLERVSPWPRRVVGSWSAAMGLLLAALALRG